MAGTQSKGRYTCTLTHAHARGCFGKRSVSCWLRFRLAFLEGLPVLAAWVADDTAGGMWGEANGEGFGFDPTDGRSRACPLLEDQDAAWKGAKRMRGQST